MERITVEELHARFNAQCVSGRQHIAVKCVMCGTVQSGQSFIAAGAGADMDAVEKFIGFSCIGRFTNAGPHKKGMPAGRGCDWSLGGLFKLHKLEVETPDGKHHPFFEIASPEEAQELERANIVAVETGGCAPPVLVDKLHADGAPHG